MAFTQLYVLVALAVAALVPAPAAAISAHALAAAAHNHGGIAPPVLARAESHHAQIARRGKKKCPNRAGTKPSSLLSSSSTATSTTTVSTTAKPTASESASSKPVPKPVPATHSSESAPPATHSSTHTDEPKPKPTSTKSTTTKLVESKPTSTSTEAPKPTTPPPPPPPPKTTQKPAPPKPKPTATPRPIPARSTKIGLAFTGNVPGAFSKAVKETNGKIFGTYNWGARKLDEVANTNVPFIPMLWGDKTVGDWDVVKRGYANMALGCNEVNQPGQSQMSVDHGVDLWKKHLSPLIDQGYTLFSHSISNAPSGLNWLEDFREACTSCWNQTSAAAIHYYSNDADGMIAYLKDAHSRLNKPLIVTEFGCVDFSGGNQQCNESEVKDFIRKTTSFMDSQSWIVAYMYFGSFTPSNPAGGVPPSSALFNNDGSLSAVGEVYVH